LILSGKLAVLQAPLLDGFTFDPFSLFDDGFGSAEGCIADAPITKIGRYSKVGR
jgi:hypothetical protein